MLSFKFCFSFDIDRHRQSFVYLFNHKEHWKKTTPLYLTSKMQVTETGERCLQFRWLSAVVLSHGTAKQWWWLPEAESLPEGRAVRMFRKRFSALGALVSCVSNCPVLIGLAPGFEDAVIEDFSWTYFLWRTIADSHPAPKLKEPLSAVATTVCPAVGVSHIRCVSASPAHVLHRPRNLGLYQL